MKIKRDFTVSIILRVIFFSFSFLFLDRVTILPLNFTKIPKMCIFVYEEIPFSTRHDSTSKFYF